MFAGSGHGLISVRHRILFTLVELRKAKAVEFIGVRVDSFICVNGTGRDGNKCARRNSHAIGKCKWAQRETGHGHWKTEGIHQHSYSDVDEGI